MERLTTHIYGYAHGAEGVREDSLTGNYCRGEFEATAIVDRLAAIEDILGEEYELDDLKTAMWCKETVGMAFSEDTDPVERLRELWFADKDGRCVVLPAKTVFELTWDAGPECDMACPVYIDGAGECGFCDKGQLFVY